MIIHRSHPESRFTIIPDETARDERLSYRARGVLADILSRHDDWATNADAMAARARYNRGSKGEGRRLMRAAFAELQAAGYLRRVRTRGPRGQFATELHIYDTPVSKTSDRAGSMPTLAAVSAESTGVPPTGTPVTGAPVTGTPATGPPATGTPATDTPANGTSSRRPITETRNGDRPDGDRHENSLSREGAAIRRAVPDATEREIREILDQIQNDPEVKRPVPYLRAAIDRGDAPALVAEARSRLAGTDGGRPEWCGKCDKRTRMIGEDVPRYCPDCHP